MPSDIRSFFGGKPAAVEEKEPAKKPVSADADHIIITTADHYAGEERWTFSEDAG